MHFVVDKNGQNTRRKAKSVVYPTVFASRRRSLPFLSQPLKNDAVLAGRVVEALDRGIDPALRASPSEAAKIADREIHKIAEDTL